LSPVICGNIFNLLYGHIYDIHSIINQKGSRECTEGLECYRGAYLVTVIACVVALALNIWSIHYTHALREEEDRLREEEERD
jgi:hypothetical protein